MDVANASFNPRLLSALLPLPSSPNVLHHVQWDWWRKRAERQGLQAQLQVLHQFPFQSKTDIHALAARIDHVLLEEQAAFDWVKRFGSAHGTEVLLASTKKRKRIGTF